VGNEGEVGRARQPPAVPNHAIDHPKSDTILQRGGPRIRTSEGISRRIYGQSLCDALGTLAQEARSFGTTVAAPR
jgi:hypothetical protein